MYFKFNNIFYLVIAGRQFFLWVREKLQGLFDKTTTKDFERKYSFKNVHMVLHQGIWNL